MICKDEQRKASKIRPAIAEARAKLSSFQGGLAVELEGFISQLTRIAGNLLTQSGHTTWDQLSCKSIEVLLVTELGLHNLSRLQFAMTIVPGNIPNREGVIASLLNGAFTEQKCLVYIQLLEKVTKMTTSLEPSDMEATGNARNSVPVIKKFLSPPVDRCINETCSSKGSLVINHAPTTVSVYTLGGPEVGLKYSLKCRSCCYIYNYSMYGKKKSIGEMYYKSARELVEVSDTTYCERELFQFYSSLRYEIA